jgi:hypothetical protein
VGFFGWGEWPGWVAPRSREGLRVLASRLGSLGARATLGRIGAVHAMLRSERVGSDEDWRFVFYVERLVLSAPCGRAFRVRAVRVERPSPGFAALADPSRVAG